MIKTSLFTLLCCLTSVVHAELDLFPNSQESTIVFENLILATINDKTISAIDVQKKMDLFFFQTYPQFADSLQARYQFYTLSWKATLQEMVHTELILSEANNREVKITDAEIREEMERRFGPQTLSTLEKMNLTYHDAWKMVKNEMIVQRMMWFFVQSKAMQMITPQMVRSAYQEYLTQHPAFQEWTYQVISLSPENPSAAQQLFEQLQKAQLPPEEALKSLSEGWKLSHPEISIQISKEYCSKETDLSQSYRKVLSELSSSSYSSPHVFKNRTKIFYLSAQKSHAAPRFESVANELKNNLVHQAITKESQVYVQKLSKEYAFDLDSLKELISDQQPFFSLR